MNIAVVTVAMQAEKRSCNTVRCKEKYGLFKRCSQKSLVSVFVRQLSDDTEEDSSENTKEKTKKSVDLRNPFLRFSRLAKNQ